MYDKQAPVRWSLAARGWRETDLFGRHLQKPSRLRRRSANGLGNLIENPWYHHVER